MFTVWVIVAVAVVIAVSLAVWRFSPARRNADDLTTDRTTLDAADEYRARQAALGRGPGGPNSLGGW